MSQKTKTEINYLKSLYFFFFIAFGFIAPFSTLFFKYTLVDENGNTANHLIGWIYFFMPLVGIMANIPAGILADKLHLGRHLITFFCFGASVFALFTGLGGNDYWMLQPLWTRFCFVFAMVMLFCTFQMPIVPTVDAETMSFLALINKRESYGTIRVWGTIGWSASCIMMGLILFKFYYLPLIYYFTAFAYMLLGIISLKGIKAKKKISPIKIPWRHLKKNKMFAWFLVFSLLNGIIFTASFIYTSYFFDDILKTPLEMGLIFGTWTIFEIPIMFFSKTLIKYLGNKWLIIAGLLLNGLRLVLFSFFTLDTPFFIKWSTATLQGAAFGLMHLGMIDFVDRQSHKNMRSTYMNISNVARTTIASAIGGKLGASLIDFKGAYYLMYFCGIASLILIIFFYFFVKGHGPKEPRRPGS